HRRPLFLSHAAIIHRTKLPLRRPPQLRPSGRVLPHVSFHHDTMTSTIVSAAVEARHRLLPNGLPSAHHRACCDSALCD
ncbi:hypothetical protein S83_053967, partial [Arachis hypogaea]